MSRWRPTQRGQASLELLAGIPVVILVILVAWQVIAVMWAGIRAEEAARRAGLGVDTTAPGVVTVVQGTVDVPGPAIVGRRLTVDARVIP